jgi:hypothetical protein
MNIKAGHKFILGTIFFLFGFTLSSNEKNEDYEVYVNQIIQSFANEMEKTYGLVCYGHGGKMPHDVEEIKVTFNCYQHVSIEQARRLEVKATERFLEIINSNEKIRPFLREFPFKPNRGKVSISFRTADNLRYTDGSVAYVTQFKNIISYCSDEETSPSLITLKKEPYEEALKIVNQTSSNK